MWWYFFKIHLDEIKLDKLVLGIAQQHKFNSPFHCSLLENGNQITITRNFIDKKPNNIINWCKFKWNLYLSSFLKWFSSFFLLWIGNGSNSIQISSVMIIYTLPQYFAVPYNQTLQFHQLWTWLFNLIHLLKKSFLKNSFLIEIVNWILKWYCFLKMV